MKLQNDTGGSFELTLVGYQFPGEISDEWDANWLVVEGRVVHPDGPWTFRDACLTTVEAAQLATWLTGFVDSPLPETELEFIEPNLRFQSRRDGGDISIRVSYELEARPAWARPAPVQSGDIYLDFPMSLEELDEAASSLRRNLDSLPPRGPWSGQAPA